MNEKDYMDLFHRGRKARNWERTGTSMQMVGAILFGGAAIYQIANHGVDIFCTGNWFLFSGFMLWMVGAFAMMRGSTMRLRMSEKIYQDSLDRLKKEFGYEQDGESAG